VRRGQPELLFSETDFQRELARGYSEDDARWSTTLLRVIAPPGAQPGTDALVQGLGELSAAQLLKSVARKWQPTQTLRRLAAYWTPALPAVALEAVTLKDANTMLAYKHGIVLRGDGPLWVIEYEGLATGRPQATLRSLEAVALGPWLTSLIALPGPAHACQSGVVEPAPALPFACPACGGSLAGDSRFCPKCGAPIERLGTAAASRKPAGPIVPSDKVSSKVPAKKQQSAAHPLKSSEELAMAEQGHPKSGEMKKPAKPLSSLPPARCPNSQCGKPVSPNQKFCTACGARLT
jgi:hypothetical protein